MPNKHYEVVHYGCNINHNEFFTSLTKAKQYYNKIKLHAGEGKILFQDRCELIEDIYFDNEWVHKEKGIRIYG